MVHCKPASTPIVLKHGLATSTSTPLLDPLEYSRLIGKSIYLTITRPDLTSVVHILSQFMQAPLLDHMTVAKRILGYLKGTTGQGTYFFIKLVLI